MQTMSSYKSGVFKHQAAFGEAEDELCPLHWTCYYFTTILQTQLFIGPGRQ